MVTHTDNVSVCRTWTLGVLCKCSGSVLGVLWECSGSALGVRWECAGNAQGSPLIAEPVLRSVRSPAATSRPASTCASKRQPSMLRWQSFFVGSNWSPMQTSRPVRNMALAVLVAVADLGVGSDRSDERHGGRTRAGAVTRPSANWAGTCAHTTRRGHAALGPRVQRSSGSLAREAGGASARLGRAACHRKPQSCGAGPALLRRDCHLLRVG